MDNLPTKYRSEIDAAKKKKNTTNNIMYQSKFWKFRESYHGYKAICPDVWKILNRVGATAATDEKHKTNQTTW